MKLLKRVLLDIEWRVLEKHSSFLSGSSLSLKVLSFA